MPDISQATQKLISRYHAWQQASLQKEGVATVHVDEVAAKVAAFYERIRGVIDWREEHLLRRAAIERILKRRLLLGTNGKDLALSFVSELIRGGYFPNDRIEEIKIEIVQKSIDKYLYILEKSEKPTEKLKVRLYDWLLGVAACEVEEILDPLRRERALIDYMTESMREKISTVPEISEFDKNTQTFVAVQRALFKLDRPIISYHLLKKGYPEWLSLPQNILQEVSGNIYKIKDEIDGYLKHPLSERFYRICERHDTPYLILGDILSANAANAQENLAKPELTESSIRTSYQQRLSKLKSRTKRAAFYSTLSIFLSKILLAFAVEIPFDNYVTHQFDQRALLLSVAMPPMLMFFLVFTIRPPKKSNLEKVVLETMKIVYHQEKKDVYLIKTPRKRKGLASALIKLFYFTTFVVSFGLIWRLLDELNFGILSRIIFLLFLSLISFAGVKVRERSKELTVEEGKGGLLLFLLDSFSLPFIKIGQWLSGQLSRYNILIITLTALIDMPLHIFTEFLEQWRNFLKEKKEEIH